MLTNCLNHIATTVLATGFFAERVSCQRVEFLASKCKLKVPYPW